MCSLPADDPLAPRFACVPATRQRARQTRRMRTLVLQLGHAAAVRVRER